MSAQMIDILSLLDAAIDDLAASIAAETSRSDHDGQDAEGLKPAEILETSRTSRDGDLTGSGTARLSLWKTREFPYFP